MSVYSGKCDLYDHVAIFSEKRPDYWENINLYMGSPFCKEEAIKIEINRPEDLVPFYPFIIGCAAHSDGKSNIWIGNKSYISQENEEMLEIYKKHLLRIKHTLKRKGLPFDPEEAAEKVGCFEPSEGIKELAKRVAKDDKRASIDGLAWSSMVQHYRDDWTKALIEAGNSPAMAKYWVETH